MDHIVDFEQALHIVLGQAHALPRDFESVPLLGSLGRVLAQPILADRDQPAFHRSTRDGFAIRAADWVSGASPKVVGEVRAGEVWTGGRLRPGDALQIMTGAPIPAGADAVVMVEHVVREGQTIGARDERLMTAGNNIVPRGSEARLGQEVVSAGVVVTAAEIALAASCGCVQLNVRPRPIVAIVATGDELVELERDPEPQQIRNSNSYAIAAMVAMSGGVPKRLDIARDLREDVRERVYEARSSDLLLLSGGVSMGEYDFVEEVLAEFGAEFFFTGVRMQPGRPVVFGRLPARDGFPALPFFGLPGNPISTQVTFHCFAELYLRALAGESAPAPRWAQATLAEDVPAKPGLTRLLPARLDGVSIKLTPWQGSGDLAANARANCYAELLPGRAYAEGDLVRILQR